MRTIRKTTDLLSTTTIAAGQNFDNALLMNAGTLENKGFEVAITGRPIQTKDWFVEVSVNAAYNKNEITELAGGRDLMEAGMQVGQNQPITYHKGRQASQLILGLPAGIRRERTSYHGLLCRSQWQWYN